MTLLTILTLWAIGCIALVILNAKFWRIYPDLESDEGKEAKARNIAPVMPQTPIPRSHIIAYYRDWFLALVFVALLSFVVWLVCNAI